MTGRNSSGGTFALALVLFTLAALTAIFMILTATLAWLSELTGSLSLSALIAGLFFALIAAVVYRFSLRSAIERMQEQMETVYDVAREAREGYEWVTGKLRLLLRAGLDGPKRE